MAELDQLFPQLMQPTTTTPLPPQQPDDTPSTTTPSLMTSPELPKLKPIDLAEICNQISASMATLDRPFLLPMPTTTTTTMPQPPSQPDSPSPTTISSTNPSELPFEIAEIPLKTLPDNPNHFYPLKPMPTTPQLTTQQPADDHLDPPPVPRETLTLLMEILFRIDRLLHNTRMPNPSLWTPAAIYRSHPNRHRQLTVHHLAHKPGTFPFAETLLNHNHNPLKAGTHNYTPAFDIHLSWRQPPGFLPASTLPPDHNC